MKLTKQIRELFVTNAMNDVPYIDYSEQIRSLSNKKAERFRKAAGIAEVDPKRLASSYHRVGGVYLTHLGITSAELKLIAETSEVLELEKLSRAQIKTRATLQHSLTSAIQGCNTRKQALEALPEFEKYLPTDFPAAIRTLPALANVVSDFVKAGWPKQQKRINPVTV